MKLGFVISMYDEINTVNSTINNIKKNNSPIIVIQSDPNQSEKLVEQNQVDFYQNNKKSGNLYLVGENISPKILDFIRAPIQRSACRNWTPDVGG